MVDIRFQYPSLLCIYIQLKVICPFSKDLVCPEPPDIQYGLVTYDGRKAAYTCNPGYIMEGNEVLTCSIRLGKWIPAPPICIEGENNHTFNLTSRYNNS